MKAIASRTPLVCILAAAGVTEFPAAAQIIAQSRFDTGTDGWTVLRFPSVCGGALSGGTNLTNFSWVSSGGSPGGFLRHPQNNSGTSFFRAPPAFRGDISAAYGGTLTFEMRFTTTDPDNYAAADEVYIHGPAGVLIADIPLYSRDAWGANEVILLPGHWRFGSCTGSIATETQIRSVLSNVTQLQIRAENVLGTDTHDLDSVVLSATPAPACMSHWTLRDDDVPPGMWRHVMAVDTDRDVLVAFGGDTGERDTWEYDLETGVWTKRATPNSPPRRGGHAMVYDRARRRMVLTGGGYVSAANLAFTASSTVWEYDGVEGDWIQATALPQARSGHAMAYDTARDVIVLYGGLGSGVTGAVDVLERAAGSADWVTRSSAVNPGPQSGYAMAYDEARAKTVLVGEGTTAISVYEWDGVAGTWEARSFTTALPGARENPGLTYDSARQRIVLVGGREANNTWDYDGTVWTQRANIAGGTRDEHALAYDADGQRVLLLGGLGGAANPQRSLLAFDGASNSWATLWSRNSLSARDLMGCTFDDAGGRTIVYGGGLVTRPGTVRQIGGGGTWVFDGNSWSALTVTGNPGSRWFNPLAYDSDRRRVIMYGGRVSGGAETATAQLWEFDPAALAWTDRTIRPAMPPGPRGEHAVAYDRANRKMIVHGGVNDVATRLEDTWIYDPIFNTWTQHTGTPSPGPRNGAAMAFDQNRGVCVLFGGRGAGGSFDNSTWEFDGVAWRDATPPTGNPPARYRHSLVYNPDRRTIVLSGGISFTTGNAFPYTDLWEYDGSQWKRLPQALPPSPQPITRLNSGMTYDTTRRQLVNFGGSSVQSASYCSGQTSVLAFPGPGCSCYPDCDTSTGPGTLDIFDFLCFQNRYDIRDSYACDCDTGTGMGVCDIFDFLCFQNAFAAGCS